MCAGGVHTQRAVATATPSPRTGSAGVQRCVTCSAVMVEMGNGFGKNLWEGKGKGKGGQHGDALPHQVLDTAGQNQLSCFPPKCSSREEKDEMSHPSNNPETPRHPATDGASMHNQGRLALHSPDHVLSTWTLCWIIPLGLISHGTAQSPGIAVPSCPLHLLSLRPAGLQSLRSWELTGIWSPCH